MTGGRWGSEWREGEKGTGLEQLWSFCLEESLGLLFPATWLARYSGILSHYKISRRNNNSAFSVLTGSEGNHQGAKQNKNNTLKPPNPTPLQLEKILPLKLGFRVSTSGETGPWAFGTIKELSLNLWDLAWDAGDQECFWVSIALDPRRSNANPP